MPTEERARATEAPLPGFDSRNPTRQDFQSKAAVIADLLEIAELALEAGGTYAIKAHVLIGEVRRHANNLNNALDSLHVTEGSDLQ